MEAEPERKGFHPGRTVGIGRRGRPQGRRQPHLDRTESGVESPEAAHGRGVGRNADSSATGIRGTDGTWL
jgi:hypothetical protein